MKDKQTEKQACSDKSNDTEIPRRGFLSIGSAALATVGTMAVSGADISILVA